MSMAESGKIVLVSCIIDFDDIQVCLRLFSLTFNACKVMKAFFIFSGQIFKKTIITLQTWRFKLKSLNQTYISSKSIMQLTKTIFSDSVIFIEKKRVEIQLWQNVNFGGKKKIFIRAATMP